MLCWLIFLWCIFQDSLMNRTFKRTAFICNWIFFILIYFFLTPSFSKVEYTCAVKSHFLVTTAYLYIVLWYQSDFSSGVLRLDPSSTNVLGPEKIGSHLQRRFWSIHTHATTRSRHGELGVMKHDESKINSPDWLLWPSHPLEPTTHYFQPLLWNHIKPVPVWRLNMRK